MYTRREKAWYDERELREAGFSRIAGVDEAGRGALAGAVVAACVMLHVGHSIKGLKDSKKLSPKRRELLYQEIMEQSISVSIARASNVEVDKINIYEATKKCVYTSILNMKVPPEFVIVDGEFTLDNLAIPYLSVHGADGAEIYGFVDSKKKLVGHHYENVAAASIIAKVYRDSLMVTFDGIFPGYGFKKHKGYGTSAHRDALAKLGPCQIHRRSFNGVVK